MKKTPYRMDIGRKNKYSVFGVTDLKVNFSSLWSLIKVNLYMCLKQRSVWKQYHMVEWRKLLLGHTRVGAGSHSTVLVQ